MKLFRGFAAAVAALSLLFSAGCASGAEDDGTLDIVCTIFPQYDFARSIAGDVPGVNLTMLLGAGQESHDYDPSSKDIAAIHDCDIFIYAGGESDSWVKDMLESVDTDGKEILSLMEIIDPLAQETVEGMETEEHDHEHDHGAIDHVDYDEHVWTSPVNAIEISGEIMNAMIRQMPGAETQFRENRDALKLELSRIDENFRRLVSGTDAPTIVVADRFPLLYFCKEYGITYYAAFSGCAASTEPSSKTVQFLIEKVKEDGISAVFKMDLSTGNVASTVAESTGAEVLTFYSCHTVSADDLSDGVTYMTLMERNYSALTKALAD